MPPRDTVDKRPNEIHDLVLQGVTLEEIGRYFGLTRERVRQLHKKSDRLQSTISKIEGFVSCGVTTSKLIEELGVTSRGLNRVLISCKRNDLLDNLALTDQAAEDELLLQLPNWVRTHLGITINELASAFEISCEKAQNTLSADSKMLMLQEDPFGEFVLLIGEDRKFSANSVTYTRESILVSLQNAAKHESPLSSTTYSYLILNNHLTGPSVPRILQIFGTWGRACQIAGVQSLLPIRQKYEKNWTEEDIIEWAIRFIRSTFMASYHEYEKWAKNVEGAPSASTIRNYMGSDWRSVRREALRRCRSFWGA
jgi:hypothetical protein